MSQKNRVHLIDEIRGLAVIGMVVVHAIISVEIFSGRPVDITGNILFIFIRQAGGALFIFISGAACRFSKNNLKRGAICFGFAMAVTLVLWLFMPSQIILFGVLHLLGISMMLFALLRKLLDKIPVLVGLIICIILFTFFYNISLGILGFPGIVEFRLPYSIHNLNFLFPFGITYPGFSSADYYPLFPWFFAFIAGSYVGIPLRDNKFPKFFYKSHLVVLQKIGRHSLIVYLAHQPVIFGTLYLIDYLA